jgi:hypothetical protein
VQITMAIADQSTWSALAQAGEYVHRSTVGELAESLYQAIQAKARGGFRERATLWLALDARLIPVAAWQEVVDEYLSRHQRPCEEFGFADVWVVGPTASWCQSLCASMSPRASA